MRWGWCWCVNKPLVDDPPPLCCHVYEMAWVQGKTERGRGDKHISPPPPRWVLQGHSEDNQEGQVCPVSDALVLPHTSHTNQHVCRILWRQSHCVHRSKTQQQIGYYVMTAFYSSSHMYFRRQPFHFIRAWKIHFSVNWFPCQEKHPDQQEAETFLLTWTSQ